MGCLHRLGHMGDLCQGLLELGRNRGCLGGHRTNSETLTGALKEMGNKQELGRILHSTLRECLWSLLCLMADHFKQTQK